MKKKILILTVIIGIILSACGIYIAKNSSKDGDGIIYHLQPMNPKDQFEGRSEEEIKAYDEYVENNNNYIKAINETREEINKELKSLRGKDVQTELGNILGTLGTSYSYQYYDQLDLKNLNVLIDAYKKSEYREPQEFESDEDQWYFYEMQRTINGIELDSKTLYTDVHNVLQYVAAYYPNAYKLNWSNWLDAAEKCDYFGSGDTMNTNTAILHVNAEDKTIGSNIGDTVTFNSNQTLSSNKASGANHDLERYSSGTTQVLTITSTGLYKFDLKGGDGGTDGPTGATGGSAGLIEMYYALTAGTKVYVNVGGHGQRTAEGGVTSSCRYDDEPCDSCNRSASWAPAKVDGGWNGGGRGITYASWNSQVHQGQGGSGGGATTIALTTGVFGTSYTIPEAKLIAAAGGGGGGSGIENGSSEYNGKGGGTGLDGTNNKYSCGTNVRGGIAEQQLHNVEDGSYGKGGDSNDYTGGGGGGGRYGGAGGIYWNCDACVGGGGGGSNYVTQWRTTFNGIEYLNTTYIGANGGSTAAGNANNTGGGYATVTVIDLFDLQFSDFTRTITYSTSPTSMTIDPPDTGSGNYVYEIVSQKNADYDDVNNFSISDGNIIAAAKTPAGMYRVELKVTDTTHVVSSTATVTVMVTGAQIYVFSNDQVYKYDGNEHGRALGVDPDIITTVDNSSPLVTYAFEEGLYNQTVVPKIIRPSESKTIYFEVQAPNHVPKTGSYKLAVSDNPISLDGINCEGHKLMWIIDDYSGVRDWYYVYKYVTGSDPTEHEETSDVFNYDQTHVSIFIPRNRTVTNIAIYARDKANNRTDSLLASHSCSIIATYDIMYTDETVGGVTPFSKETQHKLQDKDINLYKFYDDVVVSGNTSTITFNLDGGDIGEQATQVDLHSTITYSQTSWSADSGMNYGSEAVYDLNEDRTLSAVWYDVTDYESINMPNPIRTGYTFKGWATNSDGSGIVYTAGLTYDPDEYTDLQTSRILYAQWEENTYNVTYVGNGATSGSQATQQRKYTESIILPSTTGYSRTGYTFAGWYDDATGGNQISVVAANTDSNVTIYAHWNENSYTITYHGNGNTSGSQAADTRLYTEGFILPDTTGFVKTDYIFIGWFDAAEGGNRVTSVDANTDGNTDVYAHWFSLVTNYTYKGYTETYVVPIDGLYKLEVWGAQGGTVNFGGGKGGYSVGYKQLTAGTTIYVCVGGAGSNGGSGGYNGGGRAQNNSNTSYGSGGGATHMATNDGQLRSLSGSTSSVLIVAGGGGGDGSYEGGYKGGSGGSGGGTNGGGGSTGGSTGGTQTSGGYHTDSSNSKWRGGFGYGGAAGDRNTSGGGGGWYGGGACESHGCPAGGGSGYIGGVPSITYKGTTYSPSTSNGQQSGNGKARVTIVSW